jgi:hypothetical protein
MDFYFNINMNSTYVEKYSTLVCFHLKWQTYCHICEINYRFYMCLLCKINRGIGQKLDFKNIQGTS